MAKMKEGSAAYNDEAIQLALGRVTIRPCAGCGHPVNDGFCCQHCGSGEGTVNTDESYIAYKAISSGE